jgi:hypothetical protein
MKKQRIKLGNIIGSKLYLADGQDIPRHCTHKVSGSELVCVSYYQNRHNVPESHAVRNGIERVL